MQTGCWILPTYKRIEKFKKVLNSFNEIGVSTPGLIVVNRSDWAQNEAAYQALVPMIPQGWRYEVVDADSLCTAVRRCWHLYKDLDWVGLMSDDCIPATVGWDKTLIGTLQGWNFASANDGWQAPTRMGGCSVFSGKLIRAVGHIYPKGFTHLYTDDVWEEVGRETGCWQPRMDVLVRHEHEMLKGTYDETRLHVDKNYPNDGARFAEWRGREKAEMIAAVRRIQGDHGVRMVKPDFTGVNIMIATPSHSGQYHSCYNVGLFNTMKMFSEMGVPAQWAEEKHNADISLARAKILASFLRSNCSHLLMIDDDMGWTVDAVMRLFVVKKDFVTVAGPKKFYPLKFACNYTDDDNKPLPLVREKETGSVEVGEVGMAFCLITRKVAEVVTAKHPELQYLGALGQLEWAVFDPIIRNKRRYSEDFAFCRRWRDAGGSVHVVPDVPLKHVGYHTFEGRMSDSWQQASPQSEPQPGQFEITPAAAAE